MVVPECASGFNALYRRMRHQDVAEGSTNLRSVAQQGEGLVPDTCRNDCYAERGEEIGEPLPDWRVVVDDQDRHGISLGTKCSMLLPFIDNGCRRLRRNFRSGAQRMSALPRQRGMGVAMGVGTGRKRGIVSCSAPPTLRFAVGHENLRGS